MNRMSAARRSGCAFLILSLCGAFSLAAELTWQDALAETKAHNPGLVKARATLEQARQSYVKARAGFLPQVNATANASQSGTDSAAGSKTYAYGLSGSLSLFSGFSDLNAVRMGSLEVASAQAQYDSTLADTVYAVRASFISLLAAQEQAALAAEIVKRRTENYELIKFKYEAGREDKGSLMRVEADRMQAEYEASRARRACTTAAWQLLRDMGRSDPSPVTAAGTLDTLPVPPSGDIASRADATPAVRIAGLTAARAKLQVSSARSSLYPSATLSAGINQSASQWDAPGRGWNAALGLSYPLFAGGADLADIRSAASAATSAEAGLAQTRQTTIASLMAAYNAFADAVESVQVYEKYLDASAEQQRITAVKYINGLETYFNWYSVENDYISARKSLLSSRKEALLQEANWKRVTGAGE